MERERVADTQTPETPLQEVSVNQVAEFNLCNGHAKFGGFVMNTGTLPCTDRSAC